MTVSVLHQPFLIQLQQISAKRRYGGANSQTNWQTEETHADTHWRKPFYLQAMHLDSDLYNRAKNTQI